MISSFCSSNCLIFFSNDSCSALSRSSVTSFSSLTLKEIKKWKENAYENTIQHVPTSCSLPKVDFLQSMLTSFKGFFRAILCIFFKLTLYKAIFYSCPIKHACEFKIKNVSHHQKYLKYVKSNIRHRLLV